MSRRTSPPFRADHVGSLLRPPRLHQAREDFAAGRIEAAGLRAVEDEEITRAVRRGRMLRRASTLAVILVSVAIGSTARFFVTVPASA